MQAIKTMKYYSTNHQVAPTSLEQAVMQGLPEDNGLYMPEEINSLPPSFWESVQDLSFPEMSYQVAKCILNGTIEDDALKTIVYDAINFEAPLVPVTNNMSCLELFHGPSLAFKDFGARFMARIMGHFVQQKADNTLYILVATSGDTGGAVAQGFLDTPGIEVIILYPSGKISELQEKQLTTLGSNITALEVSGVFDDCQDLVKKAFLDQSLRSKMRISSANSINLARLVPQAFYYVNAYAQAKRQGKEQVVFCVPSGNFGNITAGLLAKRMGMPIERFVAANNNNDVFTAYYKSGEYHARPSVATFSNAMDVGNPSNFRRIMDLYKNDVTAVRKDMWAAAYNDDATVAAIKEVYKTYNYVMCPHTAVGFLGMRDYFAAHPNSKAHGIFLGTAHPAKFLDIVEPALDIKVDIPSNLAKLMERKKEALQMEVDYDAFKAYLLSR